MKEPNTYIVEDTIKGEMVWSIYQSRSELMGETFDSTIEINSGKNTKQDAINVIAKIKIGSCDHSIKVAIEIRSFTGRRMENPITRISRRCLKIYSINPLN